MPFEQKDNIQKNFRARILPARNPSNEERSDYIQAYKLWYGVWSEVWKEQANVDSLTSDDFYKQDYVYAIFHEDTCVALTLGTIVDLSLPVAKNLYYMSKIWTSDTHQKMHEYGTKIFLSSHITTHPEWRQKGRSISLKDIVVLFALQSYKHSNADLLLGAMRNNKNVQSLAYKYGAIPIKTIFQKEIQLEVDLIFSTRKSLEGVFDNEWGRLVIDLWNNCLDANKYHSNTEKLNQVA